MFVIFVFVFVVLLCGFVWVFEVKWDGVWVFVDVCDVGVWLSSCNECDVMVVYFELYGLVVFGDVLFDGEVVFMDVGWLLFMVFVECMYVWDLWWVVVLVVV